MLRRLTVHCPLPTRPCPTLRLSARVSLFRALWIDALHVRREKSCPCPRCCLGLAAPVCCRRAHASQNHLVHHVRVGVRGSCKLAHGTMLSSTAQTAKRGAPPNTKQANENENGSVMLTWTWTGTTGPLAQPGASTWWETWSVAACHPGVATWQPGVGGGGWCWRWCWACCSSSRMGGWFEERASSAAARAALCRPCARPTASAEPDLRGCPGHGGGCC